MSNVIAKGISASLNSGEKETIRNNIDLSAASQVEMETGTETALRSMSPLRVKQAIDSLVSPPITIGTAITASGTSIDFTGIPSWVKRVTVTMSGVSTNGTSHLLIQIGDSGGVETSGYISSGATTSSGSALASSTTGFISFFGSVSNTTSAQFTLINITGNEWVCSHVGKISTANAVYGAGDKTLSATLDRIRITTVNGTDTFDAGSINIMYE